MSAVDSHDAPTDPTVALEQCLKVLRPEQILQIDQALADAGPDDDVRLIVESGQLQCIKKVRIEVIALDPQTA